MNKTILLFLLSAVFVMAGCAANINLPAAEAQSAPNSPDHTEFTTEGKPTKTIETPWGPREIYDPTQDEEVRAAFKRIYDKDEGVVHVEEAVVHPSQGGKRTFVLKDVLDDFGNQTILPNERVQKSLHPRVPDADDLIVMQSLIEQRLDYRDLKCHKLRETTCNKTHIYLEDCFNGAPCYRVSQPAVMCRGGGAGENSIYNTVHHPIGTQFFAMGWLFDGGVKDPPAPLDYDAQLKNYFFVTCLDWKKSKIQ